ncbi:hypothetical protein BKA67DRAFT_663704 [Truncatella angustata]|uniref:Uncharacterized protein n=1 Tax=Truncatella angustata TaxID=152316 RepID=A0A9P8RHA0_9PEZI|nr:uncharacterized protein BKA67DRAFT_663704 [Truncatella angustata]KAH6645822.1 hypothetical protein BKA67DRAFT_663704 [Truncatella angustata]
MASYRKTALVSAATAVYMASASYTTTPSCLTLKGAYTNGTNLGYINVGDQGFDIYAVFVNSISFATKFGLDAGSGNLIDYDGSPYTGLITSATWEGVGLAYLHFDTPQNLQDQETAENIALTCELSRHSNILTCAHPRKPAYSVLQYCTKYENVIAISDDINLDNDCEAIVITASAARGCTVPTSTPVVTLATTTTTTTLPTSTTAPLQRYLCPSGGPTLCADGFLVKCNKVVYPFAGSWYVVPGIRSEIKCHQACVADAACGGWEYYEEEVDLILCTHTHDMYSPNVQFRFEYYFYSTGIRGVCQ